MLPSLQATEAEMQKALAQWDRQMAEYQAALDVASTPQQKAAIAPPQTADVGAKLWKSISGKTGTRTVTTNPSAAARQQGERPTRREVSTYEFEEAWAAPAVAWFLCHPEALAAVLADKPRQLAFFSEALLDSVDRIHYKSPAMASACVALMGDTTRRGYDLLLKIYSQNPDPAAKANAALAISIMLGNPIISNTIGDAATVRKHRAYYLRQAIQLAPEDAMFGNMPFDIAAEEVTYVLRYLSEGAVPPQLNFKDINGQTVLLPQPGKAHLLYFWAPMDENAFATVHHMLSVQDSYPELVICPITASPEDPQAWRETLDRYSVTTCYTDDKETTAARAYRLTQVPTAVLISANCRILYIGAPGLELQSAIMNLPKGEAPAAQPQPQPEDDEPVIQHRRRPTSTETPEPGDSAPPPLREMPEF